MDQSKPTYIAVTKATPPWKVYPIDQIHLLLELYAPMSQAGGIAWQYSFVIAESISEILAFMSVCMNNYM